MRSGGIGFLVADLPPGTWDEVMTMAQHMDLHMAVVKLTEDKKL